MMDIDRVFKALTDPKQLFDWWGREPSVELTKFEMEAKKGGRWRFECQPVPGMPQGPVVETLQRQGVNASRTLVSSRARKDYESGWLGVLRLLLKFLEEQ